MPRAIKGTWLRLLSIVPLPQTQSPKPPLKRELYGESFYLPLMMLLVICELLLQLFNFCLTIYGELLSPKVLFDAVGHKRRCETGSLR